MNVDGECSFLYCPLANSQYATITEEDGLLYLNMKTAERKHLPNKWWEKIQLPKINGEDIIEEKLKYFVSEKLLKRNIERYHRLQEVIDRIRILRTDTRSRIVPWDTRVERRMRNREKKAIIAARLNDQIENELLNRLHMGVYGEMYKDLTEQKETEETEQTEEEKAKQKEALENLEFEEAEENQYKDLEEMTHYVSDYSSADEDDIEDIVGQFEFKDWETKKRKIKQKAKNIRNSKRRKIEMEYEEEREDDVQMQ